MILRSTTTQRNNSRRKIGNRKRKPARNTRRKQVLAVKARTRTVHTQRTRWLVAILCRLTILASVAGFLYYGGHLAFEKLFFANKEYTLRNIVVEGHRTLSREHLLGLAQLEPGGNIFRVNLGKVHDLLVSDPQIKSAEVVRKLPDSIIVRVVERDPIAWVVPSDFGGSDPYAPGVSYLVDAYGVLMKTYRLHPEFMHLPIITGLSTGSLFNGQTDDSAELRAAIDLIICNAARISDPPFDIRQVDLSKRYCMVATDARHGQYSFGFNNIEAQLHKLELLLQHSRAIGREIESANLLAQRNMPVKFLPVVNESGEKIVTDDSAPQVRRAEPVR